MLKLESISCSYGKLRVINNVSMIIKNESVGVFGPNGAGKTTLINALMGLLPVQSGKITYNEEDITKSKTHEIARKGIAMVPQERELFPWMSVEDNLELGGVFVPRAKDVLEERLDFVFQMFPILRERSAQMAATMSGGQQRMLAIGRALMANPELLILDEPTLGLQPSIVSELFDKLGELKKVLSILVTEQNVRESLRSIDRGYVLENGNIVIEDTAVGLAKNPKVIESYLGL